MFWRVSYRERDILHTQQQQQQKTDEEEEKSPRPKAQ